MNKADVIAFFDRCAPEWDADMIRNEPVIQTILDNADVCAGIDVLDVACGTGVLILDYLKRSVRSVTGIDISPEMIRIAKKKFPQESVKLICGDVESVQLNRQFDCVMVYNAFPHFPNPKGLIDHFGRARTVWRQTQHCAWNEPCHADAPPFRQRQPRVDRAAGGGSRCADDGQGIPRGRCHF